MFNQILLGLVAFYCAVAWLYLAFHGWRHRDGLADADQIEIERQTFHLGLCFILSTGFLGLLQG